MTFLITLDAARVNAGYTVREAAKLLGVHYQTLYSHEKDSSNVSFSFIEKVESAYKIPKVHIFFGDKYEFIRTLQCGEVRDNEV